MKIKCATHDLEAFDLWARQYLDDQLRPGHPEACRCRDCRLRNAFEAHYFACPACGSRLMTINAQMNAQQEVNEKWNKPISRLMN